MELVAWWQSHTISSLGWSGRSAGCVCLPQRSTPSLSCSSPRSPSNATSPRALLQSALHCLQFMPLHLWQQGTSGDTSFAEGACKHTDAERLNRDAPPQILIWHTSNRMTDKQQNDSQTSARKLHMLFRSGSDMLSSVLGPAKNVLSCLIHAGLRQSWATVCSHGGAYPPTIQNWVIRQKQWSL